MTACENRPLTTSGNALFDIGSAATELQSRAREALHLLSALDDANCVMAADTGSGIVDETSKSDLVEALDRAMTFCRLATSAVQATLALGKQIERTALRNPKGEAE